ncbi:hypothetical protein D3C71_2030760 [compost metagenome]
MPANRAHGALLPVGVRLCFRRSQLAGDQLVSLCTALPADTSDRQQAGSYRFGVLRG